MLFFIISIQSHLETGCPTTVADEKAGRATKTSAPCKRANVPGRELRPLATQREQP